MFGLGVNSRPHLSSVSKSVETLRYFRIPKSLLWLAGGVLHAVAVVGVLAYLYWDRRDQISHGIWQVIAVGLAMSWSFVGPAFIWRYERYSVPTFVRQCPPKHGVTH